MLSILSPAKKLDFNEMKRNCQSSRPILIEKANEIAKIAATWDSAYIAKLMNLSPKLAELNNERFKNFSEDTNQEKSKQAAFAFAGDTYAGLDAASIDPKYHTFFQSNIRILSGLYGVLRPFDLIQAYRLEMGSKFVHPTGSSLYQFWGPRVKECLENELTDHTHKLIINLASEEYFKVLGEKKHTSRIITPKFYEIRAGEFKLISFYAKKARGLMARYIVENQITEPSELKYFNLEGYQFEQSGSSESEYIFTRRGN